MIHYRLILHLFAALLAAMGAAMAAIGLGAWVTHLAAGAQEFEASMALLLSGGVGAILGGAAWRLTPIKAALSRRDAILLVGLTWLIAPLLMALPYVLYAMFEGLPGSHPFHSFVNAYFEAASGLSTCGATILSDIESLPRSLLLWRATTHWLGGLGIVVLFVAVLPALGVETKRLFTTEAALHHEHGAAQPQFRQTARVLLVIYCVLTLVEIVALRITGLDWFQATCETFATLATGGFSVRNSSIAGYQSGWTELVIIVFMVIGGANFAIFYHLVRGRWGAVRRDRELRLYLSLLLIASALVAVMIYGESVAVLGGESRVMGIGSAIRYATFNVVSLGTDTGFATADFDQWPPLARAIIMLMAFIGGCAGSTAGGIKVMRLLIGSKALSHQQELTYRPHVVRPLRIGRRPIDPPARISALAYILLFAVTLFAGAAVVELIEQNQIDFTTAMTASLACLADAGPGLNGVGPASNYAFFSDASKLVLVFIMMLGRLEIFTLLVLVSPAFWRVE